MFFLNLMFAGSMLGSCMTYHQLYKITPDSSMKVDKHFVVFENDTLSVTYNFWAEKGLLSFAVFNKMDKPLYIDWKRSSFIVNFQKFNFWEDETSIQMNSSSSTIQRSAFYDYKYHGQPNAMLPYQYMGKTIGAGAATTYSNAVGVERKSERITFIPPTSFISNSRFILLPQKIIDGIKFKMKSYNSSDSIVVFKKNYNESNSPLKFNLFFTFSTSEDFISDFSIANKFYLSDIMELPDNEYESSGLDQNADYFYFYYKENESMHSANGYW